MVVQIFKGGRTYKGAKSAIAYLLNERLEQGTAKIYEGNPDLTLKIISQIQRKWKFTSGVISFEESYDKVKDILPKIKEQFERTFFAGLNKDQYNILYVLHTDKNRTELHFIVPRVELTTNKDLSIYTHKKDLKKKDLFQRYINALYRLSNPLDREKQETLKIEDKKWSNENKEFKKQLHKVVEQGVMNGLFSNRDEIISFLKENNLQIKRQGKDYISVINPNTNKAVRLKGEYYDENWTIDGTIEKVSRREEYTSLVRLEEELRKIVARDAEANRKKYSNAKRELIKRDKAEIRKHRLGTRAVQSSEKVEMGNRGNDSNYNNIDNTTKTTLHAELYDKSTKYDNSIRREDDRTRTKIAKYIRNRNTVGGYTLATIANFIRQSKQIDTIANTRNKTINTTNQRATTTNRKINNIITKINKYINNRIRKLRRWKMNKDLELERFKTEINIADIAEYYAFDIDREKSTRKSIVMKSERDVIIISKNANTNHYIYFNANDESDRGTIIDFVQKRTRMNLGQVRKLLRDFLNKKSDFYEIIASSKDEQNMLIAQVKLIEFFTKLFSETKKEKETNFFFFEERGITEKTFKNTELVGFKDRKFYFPLINNKGNIVGIYTTDKELKEKKLLKDSYKGIWIDKRLHKNINKIFITESPIDSLSLKELGLDDENTLHIATIGRMGDVAKKAIEQILSYYKDAELVIATDNDEAGEDIARELAEIAEKSKLSNINRLTIDNFKDINDYLIYRKNTRVRVGNYYGLSR